MFKRACSLTAMLLVLLLTLTTAAAAPADEDVHTRFSYADKPVALVLITDDQAIVNYNPTASNDQRKEGERFVKLMFNIQDNPFTGQEMQDLGDACILTDAQGKTYDSSVYTNVSMLFSNGKISLSDKQKEFGIIFCVPETTALDTLALSVDGVETAIPLSAFGEANFPAPTATPTAEPAATEAP